MNDKIILPISVVIPTYNEESHLPKLLESLQSQLFIPAEIIVADSPKTTDKTKEIAKKYGCVLVEGGAVAEGRNRGAAAATQSHLLFLDADCYLPHEYYLGEMFMTFQRNNLDIMAALVRPDKSEGTIFQKFASELYFHGWNGLRRLYKVTKRLFAEYGGAIFVKYAVFKHVEGFIETHGVYGEDYHFTKKAIDKGYKYQVYVPKVIASGRRVANPAKATKVLLGSALMGAMFAFGLYNREKLVKIVHKLYGDLGGKSKDAKK